MSEKKNLEREVWNSVSFQTKFKPRREILNGRCVNFINQDWFNSFTCCFLGWIGFSLNWFSVFAKSASFHFIPFHFQTEINQTLSTQFNPALRYYRSSYTNCRYYRQQVYSCSNNCTVIIFLQKSFNKLNNFFRKQMRVKEWSLAAINIITVQLLEQEYTCCL